LKYTIVHVNDRAKINMDNNKNILKSFEYVDDIKYFNGNIGNGRDVLSYKRIRLDVWEPYDGRTSPPLPGEYGIMVSTMNLWQYIVDNKIEKMLVLEDDIILQDDFIEKFKKCMNDLPNDFDLFSLYYFSEQNEVDEDTEIGSEYIHKSNNQYSAAQALVYSFNGAQKLLHIFKRKGYEYTNDCFIYRQAHEGLIDSYSIKKENTYFLKHDHEKIKSLIDPDNARDISDL